VRSNIQFFNQSVRIEKQTNVTFVSLVKKLMNAIVNQQNICQKVYDVKKKRKCLCAFESYIQEDISFQNVDYNPKKRRIIFLSN